MNTSAVKKFCFGRPKHSALTVREWRTLLSFYNSPKGYCERKDVEPGGRILNWLDEMGEKYAFVSEKNRCFICGDTCSNAEQQHSLCDCCYTSFVIDGCLRTKDSINAISVSPADERNTKFPKPLLSYMSDEDWEKLISYYDTPDMKCPEDAVKPDGAVSDLIAQYREKYANARRDGKCFVCGQFFSANKRILKDMCQNCYTAFFLSRKVRSNKMIRSQGLLYSNNPRCSICGKVGVYSNGMCRSCLGIETRRASGHKTGTSNSRKVALELNRPISIPDSLTRRDMGFGIKDISDVDTLITTK